MASLLDLADARLRGLLDSRKVERPSMTGLLGGTQPQGTLAGAIQGFTPTPMQAMSNQAVMDYARNVANTAKQNMAQQMSDLDKALVMDQGGINVGDRQALARLMEQVPGLMGATAYHGTPHTIRGKFDISKVGTGEGAQAYGHGMYFAENPNIAKSYLKHEYENSPLGSAQSALNRFNYDYEAAKKEIQNDIKKLKNKTIRMGDMSEENISRLLQRKQETLKILQSNNVPLPPGNLYKVDIPDEYIPNMVDWDKPLSKQPKVVQSAFRKIAKDDPDLPLDFLIKNDATGGSLMQAMDKIKANELLAKQGVTGVRYLDASSRSAKAGTSNFVIFDPTNVKILENLNPKKSLLD